ncbi:MAG: polymer-forming cytoskeletal protein [Alphaproteobacteria bacterium]|jgi:cytoskeletal protein CcmA (bactofilin family)|nr:polymer-forming cytoskeletal protein [Alphaproteobacteria bacterium]MBT7942579.1 polymer-forming cytoskeletal protein [Alphaproteobacteria bacterium]
MFSKSKKEPGSDVEKLPITKPSPPSIISADLKIVGDLNSDGEIQVDGAVDGDIRTQSLLVGETAQIKGEIVAESVFIHGSIHGQIKARDVTLAKTAHMVGDILHENLSIETGAFLEGHCKRLVEKPAAGDAKVNVFGSDDANRRLAKIKEGDTATESKGSAIKPPPSNDKPKTAVSS